MEKPIIHSDYDAHYRWAEWIRIIDENLLIRSMYKKMMFTRQFLHVWDFSKDKKMNFIMIEIGAIQV